MLPMIALKLGFVFLIFDRGNAVQTTNPVVETLLGKLQGTLLKTVNGKDFFAFRGIPYANPPIKELRFKAPEPIQRWNGIYDATENGHRCIQIDVTCNKIITGDEDCLYLNVYSSHLTPSSLKPVMVFIHGGGFTSGNGRSDLYGPERLLDKNIVLVTINYRLSALGFLSTEDSASPGNYGLLDQLQALRWVRDNVAAVGGNPQRVTIFGESAGSASVIFHTLSPLSKGLFHAAIAQSGSAINLWATMTKSEAIRNTKLLAYRLNCPTDTSEAIVQCLRRRAALDVAMKSSLFDAIYSRGNISESLFFMPVIDHGFGGEVFLPGHPKQLMENDQIHRVPLMIGINKDEGFAVLQVCSAIKGGIEHFKVEDLVNAEHNRLLAKHDSTRNVFKRCMERLSRIDPENHVQRIAAISNIFGDIFINNGVDTTVASFAAKGIPTYAYKLTYRGKHTFAEFVVTNEKDFQYLDQLNIVTHVDELQYLFKTEFGVEVDLNKNDTKMADIILTLWTNFAENGVPSLDGISNALEWTPVQPNNPEYLNLNLQPTMEAGVLSFDAELMTPNNLKEEL